MLLNHIDTRHIDKQIEAAELALNTAKTDRFIAECSDDFLYTSGRIRFHNERIQAAEATLKALKADREIMRDRLTENAYWD
jgi:hypothetical protein